MISFQRYRSRLAHLYRCLRAGYNHDSRSLRRSYHHDALANRYRYMEIPRIHPLILLQPVETENLLQARNQLMWLFCSTEALLRAIGRRRCQPPNRYGVLSSDDDRAVTMNHSFQSCRGAPSAKDSTQARQLQRRIHGFDHHHRQQLCDKICLSDARLCTESPPQ